jgi:hypothetical protein
MMVADPAIPVYNDSPSNAELNVDTLMVIEKVQRLTRIRRCTSLPMMAAKKDVSESAATVLDLYYPLSEEERQSSTPRLA